MNGAKKVIWIYFSVCIEIQSSVHSHVHCCCRYGDDQDQNVGGQESCSKKPRLSYESDEDMFADDNDENHDGDDLEESELLAFDPKDEYNDDTEVKTKKKSVPKKLQGMVSNNFVKIDLKKKNYVRGNKKMTGQQYKRQQYKSKVNSKFGKSR